MRMTDAIIDTVKIREERFVIINTRKIKEAMRVTDVIIDTLKTN